MPILRHTRKHPHNRKKGSTYEEGRWPDLERYQDPPSNRVWEPRSNRSTGGWRKPPVLVPPLAALTICIIFVLVVLGLLPVEFNGPSLADTSHEDAAAFVDYPTSDAIAPFFMPSVHYWGKQIASWAGEWGLDPNLVATVMQIESCGDPQAQSGVGAMGLFQVMAYHFLEGENAFDPQTNAARGLAYLADSYTATNGDIRLTLAGYNGGITGAQRPDNNWPDETLRYTYWGVGIYTESQEGLDISPTLQEWLDNGGVTLCWQADQRLGFQSP